MRWDETRDECTRDTHHTKPPNSESRTHPSYPFVIEVKRTSAIMAVKTACLPLYHLMSRPLRS